MERQAVSTMTVHSLNFAIHTLPLWFLVFSLFLPRVALVVAWLQGSLATFNLHGIVPLVVAVLLPRVLILYMIYVDQGLSLWFLIHLLAALLGAPQGAAEQTAG